MDNNNHAADSALIIIGDSAHLVKGINSIIAVLFAISSGMVPISVGKQTNRI